MDYNKVIILLIALIVIILVVGGIFLTNPFKKDSKLEMLSNDTAFVDSAFSVKLMDLENKSIANGSINVAIMDSNQKVVSNQSIKTNNDGEASLHLSNISEGNYTVKVTFNGNDKYNNCSLTHNLELKDHHVDTISTDSVTSNVDSGAFYSLQAGRTIYTGEVQLAPDDHHWKHMGNNEWVRIDWILTFYFFLITEYSIVL